MLRRLDIDDAHTDPHVREALRQVAGGLDQSGSGR